MTASLTNDLAWKGTNKSPNGGYIRGKERYIEGFREDNLEVFEDM
jgi:hypothetical protein